MMGMKDGRHPTDCSALSLAATEKQSSDPHAVS
jgi:hypothetical protein